MTSPSLNETMIDAHLAMHAQVQATMTLTKDDVWGPDSKFIVAKFNDPDPCFAENEPLAYKEVCVYCANNNAEIEEVKYWLNYVHGGDNILQEGKHPEFDNVYVIYSQYQCW